MTTQDGAGEPQIAKSFDELKALTTPSAETAKLFAPWITPPEEWRDHTEFEFAGFVMHFHEHNCINCGAVTHFSETFRAYRRRNDPATTRMRPMQYKLPEGAGITVFRIPVKQVPVCTHCLHSSREGTALYLVSDERAWNEAKRRDEEARLAARRSKTAERNREYAMADLGSVPSDI